MMREERSSDLEDVVSNSSTEHEIEMAKRGGCTAISSRWAHFLPAVLVLYSILKELKVGEPFMYKYQTEMLHYNATTLNGKIYPYSAYAYLIMLIPIFLFTDILLYKPTMYFEIFGQLAYRYTLVFTNNVFSQQIGQAMYGVAQASEIGFYSYIYGRLQKHQYKKLTSWTRAGTMAGRTGGYIFAQIAILTGVASFLTLNTIAFYVPCVALIVAFLMPRVQWQTLAERQKEQNELKLKKSKKLSEAFTMPKSYFEFAGGRIKKLKSDFLKIYSNGYIRKWSFWWAMTTCLGLQVAQYSQTLFGQVQLGHEKPLNGFADASYTFTATVLILALNSFPINWDKWGELALVLISSIDAVLLFTFSRATWIYPMYGCYIAYRSLYQVMISIAQWNIAKKMVCDSFGLAFGVNSFVALILQSVLTRTVVDRRGLGMQVRDAFLVYSGLHTLVALIFLGSILYGFIASRKQDKVQPRSRKSTVTTPKRSVQFSPQISVVTKKMDELEESMVSTSEFDNQSTNSFDKESSSDVASKFDSDFEYFDDEDENGTLPDLTSTSLAADFSASFASIRRR